MWIRSIANAGNAIFSADIEKYSIGDIEEWRRETDKRNLYKYLYKPLFVTLIVNKNESIVCITSVFRVVYGVTTPLILRDVKA